jgi:hypothetical protein
MAPLSLPNDTGFFPSEFVSEFFGNFRNDCRGNQELEVALLLKGAELLSAVHSSTQYVEGVRRTPKAQQQMAA